MSITDELREWGSRWEDAVAREVSEIADRIDEQHRKALEKVAAMVDEPDEQRFDVLVDGFKLGRKSDGFDTFIAYLNELEKRVDAIERKLNHKGGES